MAGQQQKVFSIGQLVDMEWKLSVAVESSNCKKLNTPLVSLLLRTLDDNGKIQAHALELTFPEFQVRRSLPSHQFLFLNRNYDKKGMNKLNRFREINYR